VTKDGVPLGEHLHRKGIKKLGALDPSKKSERYTFERHIQMTEKHFWEERFPTYTKWKKEWYDDYKTNGCFKTKTGFVCSGFMKRNEVINYPVQGAAFHKLLWSLIRLNQEIKERGMKTLIIGQIHDSIVSDVPENEVDDFLQLARNVMVDQLREAWDWIIVPLDIEAEMTPINGNWAQKKEVKIA